MGVYNFAPFVTAEGEELVGTALLTRVGDHATGRYYLRLNNVIDPANPGAVVEIIRGMIEPGGGQEISKTLTLEEKKGGN